MYDMIVMLIYSKLSMPRRCPIQNICLDLNQNNCNAFLSSNYLIVFVLLFADSALYFLFHVYSPWFTVQSGVCLTYLIFVPQNLTRACHDFGWEISTSFFLSLMVLVQIPLSWIRDIRHLTVTNGIANSLIMYGLITCLGFAFQNAIVPDQNVEEANGGEDNGDGYDEDSERGPIAEIFYKFFHLNAFNSNGWFLFIGTSVS